MISLIRNANLCRISVALRSNSTYSTPGNYVIPLHSRNRNYSNNAETLSHKVQFSTQIKHYKYIDLKKLSTKKSKILRQAEIKGTTKKRDNICEENCVVHKPVKIKKKNSLRNDFKFTIASLTKYDSFGKLKESKSTGCMFQYNSIKPAIYSSYLTKNNSCFHNSKNQSKSSFSTFFQKIPKCDGEKQEHENKQLKSAGSSNNKPELNVKQIPYSLKAHKKIAGCIVPLYLLVKCNSSSNKKFDSSNNFKYRVGSNHAFVHLKPSSKIHNEPKKQPRHGLTKTSGLGTRPFKNFLNRLRKNKIESQNYGNPTMSYTGETFLNHNGSSIFGDKSDSDVQDELSKVLRNILGPVIQKEFFRYQEVIQAIHSLELKLQEYLERDLSTKDTKSPAKLKKGPSQQELEDTDIYEEMDDPLNPICVQNYTHTGKINSLNSIIRNDIFDTMSDRPLLFATNGIEKISNRRRRRQNRNKRPTGTSSGKDSISGGSAGGGGGGGGSGGGGGARSGGSGSSKSDHNKDTCKKEDPCKKDPCKPDPCKPDPCKPDPCKPDPCKPDPCKKDPCKPDPCKSDPCKSNPCKPNPCKPDPCKPDPCKSDPCKPDPCKPACCKKEDSGKKDPFIPDPRKPDSVKIDPFIPDPCKPGPCKPDPCKSDSCKSDSCKSDAGGIQKSEKPDPFIPKKSCTPNTTCGSLSSNSNQSEEPFIKRGSSVCGDFCKSNNPHLDDDCSCDQESLNKLKASLSNCSPKNAKPVDIKQQVACTVQQESKVPPDCCRPDPEPKPKVIYFQGQKVEKKNEDIVQRPCSIKKPDEHFISKDSKKSVVISPKPPEKIKTCAPLSQADTRYCGKQQFKKMVQVKECKKQDNIKMKEQTASSSTVCNAVREGRIKQAMKKDWLAVKIQHKIPIKQILSHSSRPDETQKKSKNSGKRGIFSSLCKLFSSSDKDNSSKRNVCFLSERSRSLPELSILKQGSLDGSTAAQPGGKKLGKSHSVSYISSFGIREKYPWNQLNGIIYAQPHRVRREEIKVIHLSDIYASITTNETINAVKNRRKYSTNNFEKVTFKLVPHNFLCWRPNRNKRRHKYTWRQCLNKLQTRHMSDCENHSQSKTVECFKPSTEAEKKKYKSCDNKGNECQSKSKSKSSLRSKYPWKKVDVPNKECRASYLTKKSFEKKSDKECEDPCFTCKEMGGSDCGQKTKSECSNSKLDDKHVEDCLRPPRKSKSCLQPTKPKDPSPPPQVNDCGQKPKSECGNTRLEVKQDEDCLQPPHKNKASSKPKDSCPSNDKACPTPKDSCSSKGSDREQKPKSECASYKLEEKQDEDCLRPRKRQDPEPSLKFCDEKTEATYTRNIQQARRHWLIFLLCFNRLVAGSTFCEIRPEYDANLTILGTRSSFISEECPSNPADTKLYINCDSKCNISHKTDSKLQCKEYREGGEESINKQCGTMCCKETIRKKCPSNPADTKLYINCDSKCNVSHKTDSKLQCKEDREDVEGSIHKQCGTTCRKKTITKKDEVDLIDKKFNSQIDNQDIVYCIILKTGYAERMICKTKNQWDTNTEKVNSIFLDRVVKGILTNDKKNKIVIICKQIKLDVCKQDPNAEEKKMKDLLKIKSAEPPKLPNYVEETQKLVHIEKDSDTSESEHSNKVSYQVVRVQDIKESTYKKNPCHGTATQTCRVESPNQLHKSVQVPNTSKLNEYPKLEKNTLEKQDSTCVESSKET